VYLSKLVLNLFRKDVCADLRNCQQMHKRLLSAFPVIEGIDGKARQHFGVLYRLEDSKSECVVLVQSKEKPDWEALPEGYLISKAEVLEIGSRIAKAKNGSVLRFKLCANPTVKEFESAKRKTISREEDLFDWLKHRGDMGGFKVFENESGLPKVRVVRDDTSGYKSAKMSFSSVTFEGILKVTDENKFQTAVKEGIGTGKAYGHGLISFVPAG
jgi:CRISPR system Cascade subunit CasE